MNRDNVSSTVWKIVNAVSGIFVKIYVAYLLFSTIKISKKWPALFDLWRIVFLCIYQSNLQICCLKFFTLFKFKSKVLLIIAQKVNYSTVIKFKANLIWQCLKINSPKSAQFAVSHVGYRAKCKKLKYLQMEERKLGLYSKFGNYKILNIL